MKQRYFNLIFLGLITVAVLLFSDKGIDVLNSINQKASANDNPTVVIDAGHGGIDPGKVGINGALEKDINLAICMKLKTFLELNDINVIMTRIDDNGLYSDSDSNKKNADLRKRVQIINDSSPVIAVSIHQNSFEQESSHGAQVFYHSKSPEGKILADIIQKQIKRTVKDDNHRVSKSNESYYMLKQSNCPLVIVECGFLSNRNEAELLCSEAYQEKLAWAVHLSILNYINNPNPEPVTTE